MPRALLAMAFACLLTPATQAGFVYSNNFESGDTAGWSTPNPVGVWSNPILTETTPVGSRRFLGRFGVQEVHLTLGGLPGASAYRLAFDLYLTQTWDGNYVPEDPEAGPDEWGVSVVGGPTFLYTTFSNYPTNAPYNRQAYPGPYPGGVFPGQTGASERDTLGYTGVFDPSDPDRPSIDSVYHFDFTFEYTPSSIDIRFVGHMHDYGIGASIPYEAWGLDNVQLTSVPEPSATALAASACLGGALLCSLIRRSRAIVWTKGLST